MKYWKMKIILKWLNNKPTIFTKWEIFIDGNKMKYNWFNFNLRFESVKIKSMKINEYKNKSN